jgi:tetrahydromethanopterin S-methyltransferase subunit C
VSADNDTQAPPAGEEIHLPGESIQPLLLAIGITITLVGVTISWILTILGGIFSIWIIVRWIADTRRDIAELPAEHE